MQELTTLRSVPRDPAREDFPTGPRIPNGLILVRKWDMWVEAQDRSPDTRRRNRYAIYRFLAEIAPEDLADLTEEHLVQFLAGIGPRASAKKVYVQALRSFFKWAAARGHLPTDITSELQPKKPNVPPPVALTEEELTRLVVAASWRDPLRGWAVLACYSLGTRRGEFTSIRPEDVDFENGVVRLIETKGRKPRDVEIGPLARAALEALRPWWGRSRRASRSNQPDFRKSGDTILGGIQSNTFTEWVHEAATLAELPQRKKRSHVLRATFATNLAAGGIPVSVIAEMLGHYSVAVTTKYLAVTAGDRRRAVELL
jgi:integrase/recombinase XerD